MLAVWRRTPGLSWWRSLRGLGDDGGGENGCGEQSGSGQRKGRDLQAENFLVSWDGPDGWTVNDPIRILPN